MIKETLRVHRGFGSFGGPHPHIEVSMKHGYLWIGPKGGRCLVYISGKKTLHKIAAMIRKYAL